MLGLKGVLVWAIFKGLFKTGEPSVERELVLGLNATKRTRMFGKKDDRLLGGSDY